MDPHRAERAETLKALGTERAWVAHGDGYAGLEKAAPFQSIIVAAAALFAIPGVAAAQDAKGLQELIDNAKAGGEVVIPKGTWAEPIKIDKPLKPTARIITPTRRKWPSMSMTKRNYHNPSGIPPDTTTR